MEPTLDIDDELDERGPWQEHGLTRKLVKFYDAQAQSALKNLMNACAQTTDPRVAKAFGEYTVTCGVQASLRPGKKP